MTDLPLSDPSLFTDACRVAGRWLRVEDAAAGIAVTNPADGSTEKELLNAMLQVAESGQGPAQQFSSMGCSIKWK